MEKVQDFIHLFETEIMDERTNYELRLGNDEAELIRKKYPKANVEKISGECRDGKFWYNINILAHEEIV